jgi:hypothetical protein
MGLQLLFACTHHAYRVHAHQPGQTPNQNSVQAFNAVRAHRVANGGASHINCPIHAGTGQPLGQTPMVQQQYIWFTDALPPAQATRLSCTAGADGKLEFNPLATELQVVAFMAGQGFMARLTKYHDPNVMIAAGGQVVRGWEFTDIGAGGAWYNIAPPPPPHLPASQPPAPDEDNSSFTDVLDSIAGGSFTDVLDSIAGGSFTDMLNSSASGSYASLMSSSTSSSYASLMSSSTSSSSTDVLNSSTSSSSTDVLNSSASGSSTDVLNSSASGSYVNSSATQKVSANHYMNTTLA